LKELDDDETELTRVEKFEGTSAIFRKNMEEFSKLMKNTWHSLMKSEMSLYEETEVRNQDERIKKDKRKKNGRNK